MTWEACLQKRFGTAHDVRGGEIQVPEEKLQQLSDEVMRAAGMLLKNENGPGRCDTQAIRILLNVADELLEFSQLQAEISRGKTILC